MMLSVLTGFGFVLLAQVIFFADSLMVAKRTNRGRKALVRLAGIFGSALTAPFWPGVALRYLHGDRGQVRNQEID